MKKFKNILTKFTNITLSIFCIVLCLFLAGCNNAVKNTDDNQNAANTEYKIQVTNPRTFFLYVRDDELSKVLSIASKKKISYNFIMAFSDLALEFETYSSEEDGFELRNIKPTLSSIAGISNSKSAEEFSNLYATKDTEYTLSSVGYGNDKELIFSIVSEDLDIDFNKVEDIKICINNSNELKEFKADDIFTKDLYSCIVGDTVSTKGIFPDTSLYSMLNGDNEYFYALSEDYSIVEYFLEDEKAVDFSSIELKSYGEKGECIQQIIAYTPHNGFDINVLLEGYKDYKAATGIEDFLEGTYIIAGDKLYINKECKYSSSKSADMISNGQYDMYFNMPFLTKNQFLAAYNLGRNFEGHESIKQVR